MHHDDAYAELGLAPGASDADIKATWRRLVARWHPDRNPRPDASSRMQRINHAYLSIRQARGPDADADVDVDVDHDPDTARGEAAAYTSGQADPRRDGADPAAPQAAEHGASTPGAEAEGAPRRTVRRKLRITLEEAALGCTRVLSGRLTIDCAACAGCGWQGLASACGDCQGRGTVRRPTLFGWLGTTESCDACGGQGQARSGCEPCGQRGRRRVAYRRSVRLPAGVQAGDVLTAAGGHHGGAELMLELQLDIEPHPFFTLDPDGTLHCEIPVDGFAWVGERWIEVPTPSGLQAMQLCRDERKYRLRGQGFPRQRRGERADLVVEVRPCFPDTLSAAQQALLDRLMAEAALPQALADWQHQLQAWKGRPAAGAR